MLLQEPIKKVVNNLFDCRLKSFMKRAKSLLNEPIRHDQNYGAGVQKMASVGYLSCTGS